MTGKRQKKFKTRVYGKMSQRVTMTMFSIMLNLEFLERNNIRAPQNEYLQTTTL